MTHSPTFSLMIVYEMPYLSGSTDSPSFWCVDEALNAWTRAVMWSNPLPVAATGTRALADASAVDRDCTCSCDSSIGLSFASCSFSTRSRTPSNTCSFAMLSIMSSMSAHTPSKLAYLTSCPYGVTGNVPAWSR